VTAEFPVVCQIIQTAQLGGAELLALRITRACRDRIRFLVACLEMDGPIVEHFSRIGIEVQRFPKHAGLDIQTVANLRRWLYREAADLVHAHQCGPFLYAALARRASSRPTILLTEHGRQHPDVVGAPRRVVNRLLLRRADRVVAVGSDVRRALVEKENFPASRVEVIYNGIDLDAVASAFPSRDAIRSELGLRRSEFVVSVCARLDPIKDHATTLLAFQRLLTRHPDARLIVVGDGPERVPISSACDVLGLREQILLLGLRTDVPRLLAASDAAILTSRSEGIPLFLLEAMAARLPVVATRVGGIPEVVEDGVTGRLAPAGDANALGDHLAELAARPDLRAHMGAAGRARAEARFAESRMIDEYRRLYEQMCRGGIRAGRVPAMGV
jgi:glycosyltransferase involved in cell wall biosynthesis